MKVLDYSFLTQELKFKISSARCRKNIWKIFQNFMHANSIMIVNLNILSIMQIANKLGKKKFFLVFTI